VKPSDHTGWPWYRNAQRDRERLMDCRQARLPHAAGQRRLAAPPIELDQRMTCESAKGIWIDAVSAIRCDGYSDVGFAIEILRRRFRAMMHLVAMFEGRN